MRKKSIIRTRYIGAVTPRYNALRKNRRVLVGGCVTSACTGGSLFMSSATRPNSGHGYKNISAPNNMLPNDA